MKEKNIIKLCPTHGETHFRLRADNRYRCLKCCTDSVTKRRRKLKEKAIEYKGGKCQICNYSKCLSALEFHHLNPEEKDFAIGHDGITRSWEKIKIELDKCILVCANCHREIHHEIYTQGLK